MYFRTCHGHVHGHWEQRGFKRASRAGIDVIVNTTGRVDLVLEPGSTSETITVEAETPILQTERADTGRKLETVLTENVPLAQIAISKTF